MTQNTPAPALSVDAGEPGLLAHLDGTVPPAPPWFSAALAQAPERQTIMVDGAGLELLTWGPVGAPGLLFLHGNGAHADWWSFIAPAFADNYRVAAISWSGMGRSDWRASYSIDTFCAELMAGAAAGGLFASTIKPVMVGHSFGGFPTLATAARHGGQFRAAITVDSPIFPPDSREDGPPQRSRPNRIYPTFNAALARFRLAPPQPCANLFLVDHVARGSIKSVPEGFTWRFDPFLWASFRPTETADMAKAAACPIGIMWGAQSRLCTPAVMAHMRTVLPASTVYAAVDGAAHHVMLDQPLAFVASLSAMLDII